MASSEIEKTSTDSYHKNPRRDDVAQVLDERRRAALAEIDNAKFSYVTRVSLGPFLSYCILNPLGHVGGSM